MVSIKQGIRNFHHRYKKKIGNEMKEMKCEVTQLIVQAFSVS